MILIKYSKTQGAEFIPHLDTLRHLGKTVRRTGVDIKYSQGFNPHMLIFMSSPIALGLKSECELCLFDSDANALEFKALFNANSPKGIRCLEAYNVDKKIKVVADVTSAIYEIQNINKFNVDDILKAPSFTVFDKRSGTEKDVLDRIVNLYFLGDKLYAELKFGNVTLRPDYLVEKLISLYGGEHPVVVKKDVRFLNGLTLREYLRPYL